MKSHFLSHCFNHQTFSTPFFLITFLFLSSSSQSPYTSFIIFLTLFIYFLFSSDIFSIFLTSNSYIIPFILSLSLSLFYTFPSHAITSLLIYLYITTVISIFLSFVFFFLIPFFVETLSFLLWCYRIKPQTIWLSLSAHEESNFFLTFNLLNRHIWLISHTTIHSSYLASQLHEASKDFEFWWRLRSRLIAFLLITSSTSFTSNLRPFSWKCNSPAQPCLLLQNINPHPHLQPRLFELWKH